MARRRNSTRTRTVYRTAKKVYSRARSGGKSFGGVINGVIAGAAGTFGARYLGGWAQPVADIGIGYWRRSEALQVIGGRTLGAMLVSGIGQGTTSNDIVIT